MNKRVFVGKVPIGGGSPISIQTMSNLSVTDIDGVLRQIDECRALGCDIMRVAVPNIQSVRAFAQLRRQTDMPLVADIHFDYRLAVAAAEAGADKLRINPGNIPADKLDLVIDCVKAHDIPVRIGVNAGSINKQALARCNGDRDEALASSLGDYVHCFERKGFDNLVLSVKSSDVAQTVRVNRKIAALGYPIHIGVTEAGLAEQGMVKNAIGIGALLLDGIGDTVRVSLTADPSEEVRAAKQILSALGLRKGVTFVSCPQCGRCTVNLQEVAACVYERVRDLDKNVKIAVMGCEVNGPGECSDATLGMAGAGGKFVFFKKGQRYRTVDADVAVEEFCEEVDALTDDN